MTPLERAARALCELAGNPPGATMDGKPLWMDYLPEVRAVIEAIREPSEATRKAGLNAIDPLSPGDLTADREADAFWTAMIDALLAEGK